MCDKSVTFIIPIFKLEQHRINNLKFILPYLINTGKKVLVAEQVDKNESELSEILNKFPSVEHKLFITNEQRFHKSGIINWAVINHVNTKYAWVNDVDYYMKYIDVLEQDWTELFIQPYDSAKKLDETVSKMICEGNTVNIDYNDETAMYLSMYGALSFIFDVYAFISAGAMDESIFELGKEDVELFDRISKKHNIQILNFKGIHLYHPIKNELIRVSVEHEKDLAIVTCYFNWCGFANPIKNLHRFIRQMQDEEVPLYGIELSLTDKFETVGIEGWKQIKVNKENICFQKEACINLAVSELVPYNYTKIAWIDADLTFTNPNWYRDTSISLNKYKAVQMFSVYLYTDECGKVIKKIPSIMKNGGPRKETLNSSTAKHLNGVPGGAWAARRELWNNGGLYPYAFVGGGDCAFIYSLFGLESEGLIKTIIGIVGTNEKCFKFSTWKSNIVSYIDRSISHVNGEVVHSWHGDIENKAYNTRHQLYELVNIDGDVQCPKDGILSIQGGNLEVYDKIFSYFNNRKEDGDFSSKKIKRNKTVVYTCIVGDYDVLKEVASPDATMDYVCFSDRQVSSTTWEIRDIPEILRLLPPVKIARCIKIMPHLFLKEYDVSLWVDGSIQVLDHTNEFISKNLNGYFAVSKHPHRNCIYEEASAVLKRQKDSADVVISQIIKYRGLGYPEKHGLVQTGIIIRRHNDDACKSICNDWWKEVLTNSKRDQLSFNFVIWKKFASIDLFDATAFTSKYFQLWPHGVSGQTKAPSQPIETFVKNYINGIKI